MNSLTNQYHEFIARSRGTFHGQFVDAVITALLAEMRQNTQSILLFGGLVRDGVLLEGWSDLDIIIVLYDFKQRDPRKLSKTLGALMKRYATRIDMTQLAHAELADELFMRATLDSEILNALAMRDNVTMVVFGSPPIVAVTQEQERVAARAYLMNTVRSFRRFVIEAVPCEPTQEQLKGLIPRAARWTFSSVRAGLRARSIYTHPYEESIPHFERLFPSVNTSILWELTSLRRRFKAATIPSTTLIRIEEFLETAIPLMIAGGNEHDQQIVSH